MEVQIACPNLSQFFQLSSVHNQKVRMVFTLNQQTAFFENDDQMGLPNRTRVYLKDEGIVSLGDLVEFIRDNSWSQIIKNCKRPPQIPDPNNPAGMINQPPFRLPSKSLLRMKVAALAVDYYNKTARTLSAANMSW